MASAETINALNRLYAIHYRSLPMYLGYAKPYALRGDEQARETLNHIVADQKAMVERIGEMILDMDAQMHEGEFPMEFTGYHDLTYDYLVQRMIDRQKIDIALIEQCADRLNTNPLAKALADEALGLAKGHLENLEELTQKAVSSAE